MVTCERCAEKLHYKRRNENELEGKQEQEENKRKRNPDIELVSERSGLDYRFPNRYVEPFLSQYSYDHELDLVVGKHKWRWKQVPEEKEGRLHRKKIFVLLPTSCKFGYLLLGSWRIVSFFSPGIGVILLMSGGDSCVACCLLGYPLSVIMSGGTPIGEGYMRQRHSRGYASSGDDLEVGACSWSRPTSPASVRGWPREQERERERERSGVSGIPPILYIIYYIYYVYLIYCRRPMEQVKGVGRG